MKSFVIPSIVVALITGSLSVFAFSAGALAVPRAVQQSETNLEKGIAVCRIGDPSKFKATLVIDESKVEFVQIGQPVRLMLESRPGWMIRSQVAGKANRPMSEIPAGLSTQYGGGVATTMDESGKAVPQAVSYQVSAPIPSGDTAVCFGMQGYAKVLVGRLSIGQRILRFAQRTFHFDLQ